jgi:hypothetical protein
MKGESADFEPAAPAQYHRADLMLGICIFPLIVSDNRKIELTADVFFVNILNDL